MNTFFKIVTLTIAFFALPTVHAAEANKIGVVFPSKIMKESPLRERSIKKLEAEFKNRYEALQALEKGIKDVESKIKRDGELLSTDELTALQRKMEVKVSEYKINRKAFEDDNRRRQGEEQQKALTVIREVIAAVAETGNYDLIFNGEQVIFTKPGLDISDIVIEEISKK